MKALQDTYAPHSTCFGCGPSNAKGLRIKTIAMGDHTEATWTPESHHEAFPGMLNGGIVGALLDCHSNWTAAWTLMTRDKQDSPPCTVTAEFSVKLLRPTPSGETLKLRAHAKEAKGSKVLVEAELLSGDSVCATCIGTFVAVKPGHPAYHRW